MIYAISVILCAFMFAALFVSANKGAMPGHNMLGIGGLAVIAFITLCPYINTIVALAGVISCGILFYGMYKDRS